MIDSFNLYTEEFVKLKEGRVIRGVCVLSDKVLFRNDVLFGKRGVFHQRLRNTSLTSNSINTVSLKNFSEKNHIPLLM